MRLAVRPLIAGLSMLATAALAEAMWPSQHIADQVSAVDLQRMVPLQFAGWRFDTTLVPVSINPPGAAPGKVYTQTLARAYVNNTGERVMLSIAYGPDQRGSATQVHQPESCYTMQGFRLVRNVIGSLDTGFGTLPVKRLMAIQGARVEPITYWMTVGDRAALPGLDRKLAQLRYGLTGRVADGLLVRVSTIGGDADRAYGLQDSFIRDFLAVVSDSDRLRLTGGAGA